jgi:para-nitrobenzyl esterase
MVGSNNGEGKRGAWDRWAAAQSSAGAPSFLYQFSYVPERLWERIPGAPHSAELGYVWNTLDRSPTTAGTPTDTDRAVARVMHSCWVAFAKYRGEGPLDCGNGLVWPTYDPADDPLMEFGERSGVRSHFRKEEWDRTIAGEPERPAEN